MDTKASILCKIVLFTILVPVSAVKLNSNAKRRQENIALDPIDTEHPLRVRKKEAQFTEKPNFNQRRLCHTFCTARSNQSSCSYGSRPVMATFAPPPHIPVASRNNVFRSD
nr:hypothetical protein [Dechloromonas denitrificans]